MRKKTMIERLRNIYMMDNHVYYIGPKFIGNYGYIYDELSYKDAKHIINNCEVIEDCDDVFILLHKQTRVVAKHVYVNSNGNVFFLDGSLNESYYFNKNDSRKIIRFYNQKGKKKEAELEDLLKLINEK